MNTGCLKATPIPCLYALAGIAHPHIRRKVASNADRCLQEDDPIHPLYGRTKHRLPYRNRFLTQQKHLSPQHKTLAPHCGYRCGPPFANDQISSVTEGSPNERLVSGTHEPWSTWRMLSRLRVQKGRCRAIIKMWKLSHTYLCDCGERKTMNHPMTCGDARNCPYTYLAIP